MALTVNTNIASLTAQRNLTGSQNDLSTSLQRLSSGLRINSAKDDAAGLSISSRFEAQIRGLNQGVRNANDGISLAQTAEGALAEVTNNLQRIRELAVQSANATNSSADRATLQAEVSALISEIDRVASQTNFNNIKLLDGSFNGQSFQVGANSGETVQISTIVNARSAALGGNSLTFLGSSLGTATNVALVAADGGSNVASESDLTISTTSGGSTGNISYDEDSAASEIAAAINNATAVAGNGVTATASNVAYLSGLSADGAIDLTIKSEDSVGVSTASTISSLSVETTDLSALVTAINADFSSTGIIAETVVMAEGDTGVKLTQVDGKDITLQGFAHDTASSTLQVGKTNNTTTNTDAGRTLEDGGLEAARIFGDVTLTSSQGAISLGGANADATGVLTSTATTISSLSISTASNAVSALATIDAALDTVNSGRGALGAIQNRFESVVASQQVASENLSASKSRIEDADFAAETAALTKAQILQQSGIAMLAQANAIPQNVLALLQ